jgi:hypothetical protein
MIACLLPEIATEDCALLPFLANTNRQYITGNPIVQAEVTYLRRTYGERNSRLRKLKNFGIAVSLTFAMIPLWIYIDESRVTLRDLMIVGISSIRVAVGIRAMLLASNSITRLRIAGEWDDLVLTKIDGNRIVFGKWWATMLYTWRSHLVAAMLSLGLAYGLTQYLHIMTYNIDCSSWMKPFCHVSHNGPYDSFYPYESMKPNIFKVVLAGVTSIFYSFVEGGFWAALGIMTGLFPTQNTAVKTVVGITIRVGLAMLPLLVLTLSSVRNTQLWSEYGCCTGGGWCAGVGITPGDSNQPNLGHDQLRLLETLQVSFSTLIDGGTLLTVNLMRPIGCTLFTIRNIVSAVIGLAIYIALRRWTLGFAEMFAIRRGASRPIDT